MIPELLLTPPIYAHQGRIHILKDAENGIMGLVENLRNKKEQPQPIKTQDVTVGKPKDHFRNAARQVQNKVFSPSNCHWR